MNEDKEEKEKLSVLFKMLSSRLDNKILDDKAAKLVIKKTKKRIKQTKGLEDVSKRLKGKRTKRKRTSVDGSKPHSHLYSKGDIYTNVVNKHKHKISKDNKRALAGKTGHSHKLKNPY